MMDSSTYIQYALALFVLAYLLFLLTTPKSNTKNIPPGPSPLPIFGNLLKLLPYTTKPHKYFAELAKTHGPIMTLKLGSVTAIIISTPTLAKQALLKHHQVSSTLYKLDAVRAHEHDVFSVGALSATSPKWKMLRKIYSNQLLSDHMIEAMQRHRLQVLDNMLCYIKKSSQANVSVDVGQVVFDASFNMMFSTIFSLDLVCESRLNEFKILMSCIIKEIGTPNIADFYHFLKVIDPQRIRRRLTKYSVKVFKYFDEILEMRLKLKQEQVKCPRVYNDLLDVILEVMEEQSDEIKREDVHHLLLDLLGAGMDTTSKTIEWAMTELLKNPNMLSKLQEEIHEVVGSSGTTQAITESNISQLPYLQAVVTETLRLHPTAPLLLPRKVQQPIEIDGFVIPEDSMLIVNTWAIGRDPLTWGEPDVFTPERFVDDAKVDVKAQVIKLFTFGAGKKICPGMSLGLRVSYFVLANLVSSFNWKLDDDFGELQQDMDMMDDYYGITLKKTKSLRAFPINR